MGLVIETPAIGLSADAAAPTLLHAAVNVQFFRPAPSHKICHHKSDALTTAYAPAADVSGRLPAQAAAGFDLLVVDEAHHLSWAPEQASADYLAVATLAAQISGVLLLTATPDQLGHAAHFARLRLLDPDRFADYPQFCAEERQFRAVAKLAEALLGDSLPDAATSAALIDMVGERDIVPLLKQLALGSEDGLRARQELLAALIDRHGTSRLPA